MEEQGEDISSPLPCRKGCGFFGNSLTGGMCSVCFKDFKKENEINNVCSTGDSAGNEDNQPPLSEEQKAIDPTLEERAKKDKEVSMQKKEKNPIENESLHESKAEPCNNTNTTNNDSNTKSDHTPQMAFQPDTHPSISTSTATALPETLPGSFIPEVIKSGTPRKGISIEPSAGATEVGACIGEGLAEEQPKKVQANPGLCWKCNVKINWIKQASNKCKCGYVFCDKHRSSVAHECEFDYRTSARDKVAKDNPIVLAAKIEKI